jgi:DNA-binding beta-propeller fold protein YncE
LRYLIAVILAYSAFAQSGYQQLKKWPVGGDGGWDYLTVDPDNHRLFLSHATEVDVIDTINGQVVKKISGLKGVHGIALAPEFNRGFISNGQANTVTVFDFKTLAKVGDEIPVGKNPDAILYDTATKEIFVFNGGGKSLTVIDPSLLAVVGNSDLEGRPEFAASNGEFAIFVNIEDKNVTLRLDARKMLMEQRWPLAPCEEPSSMAIDLAHRRLFVGCGNKMMAVVNTEGGKVMATVPICSGVDATVFDPGAGLVFNSCGDGALTVVRQDSADRYSVADTLQTPPGSRTMALNPATHELYVTAAEFTASPAPAEGQRPRRTVTPGTLQILVYGK